MKDPDWLLDSTPREVQIEALRRSYCGFSLKEGKDDEGTFRQLRSGSVLPAVGWSHYMEMRLGKTPTAMNEFELFSRDYGTQRIIVFCPNSFKQGWLDEAKKSGASVPWFRWESKDAKKIMVELEKTKGQFGLAINYEASNGDATKALMDTYVNKKTYLAFDESIKLKDHLSRQTKDCLAFAKDAGIIRNLSGLAMTQGPQDLYSQFRVIRQLNGLNFYAYRNKHCIMGGFKGKKVKGAKDPVALERLIKQTGFVAKRIDWSNPSNPEFFLEELTLTTNQATHYDDMNKEMTTMLDSGFEITVDMVVTKLMKLQQISSGFIYNEGTTHLIENPAKVPKMLKLLDMMEEVPGKIVVVYHYSQTGDSLLECLKRWNPATIRSAEWMKKNGRDVDEEKRRFNGDPECRVMVLQTSSGKYGHDLSGNPEDRCGTMIFYENTYSLDDRTQIEARNTTAFQDWPNTYHDFVGSPVERAAVESLAAKSDLVASILGHYRRQ